MSPDSGLIFGLLIRLAARMGYHGDPDIFQLSAFEREMRRRTWSLCMQLDLLTSFQLGLPSNIQFPTWDTRPPRNLLDSDFNEETKELPPARPDSEPTDTLFYIAKHRLMAVFEKILRHTLSTGTNESTHVVKSILRLEMCIWLSQKMQSPFAGDQASAHDVVPPHSLQDFAAQQTEVNWTGSEPMTRPTDDFSWAYLEHFLNLSDDHSMPSI